MDLLFMVDGIWIFNAAFLSYLRCGLVAKGGSKPLGAPSHLPGVCRESPPGYSGNLLQKHGGNLRQGHGGNLLDLHGGNRVSTSRLQQEGTSDSREP